MPKILYSRRMDKSSIQNINKMKKVVKKTLKEEWTLSQCIDEAVLFWIENNQTIYADKK